MVCSTWTDANTIPKVPKGSVLSQGNWYCPSHYGRGIDFSTQVMFTQQGYKAAVMEWKSVCNLNARLTALTSAASADAAQPANTPLPSYNTNGSSTTGGTSGGGRKATQWTGRIS